jgi:hypothetical protein
VFPLPHKRKPRLGTVQSFASGHRERLAQASPGAEWWRASLCSWDTGARAPSPSRTLPSQNNVNAESPGVSKSQLAEVRQTMY